MNSLLSIKMSILILEDLFAYLSKFGDYLIEAFATPTSNSYLILNLLKFMLPGLSLTLYPFRSGEAT